MKSYEKENDLFDQRSKEKLNLESELNTVQAKLTQIGKHQNYENQMTDYHVAAVERGGTTMNELSSRKRELECEIAELTDKIGDKETALDLRKKFETIHSELASKLEEKLCVEKIKTNLDISVSKEKANINEEIQKYNWWVLQV